MADDKKMTPLKAIRAKCLDCSCDNTYEVRMCPVSRCPLYDFRFGKDPNRKGKLKFPDGDIERRCKLMEEINYDKYNGSENT